MSEEMQEAQEAPQPVAKVPGLSEADLAELSNKATAAKEQVEELREEADQVADAAPVEGEAQGSTKDATPTVDPQVRKLRDEAARNRVALREAEKQLKEAQAALEAAAVDRASLRDAECRAAGIPEELWQMIPADLDSDQMQAQAALMSKHIGGVARTPSALSDTMTGGADQKPVEVDPTKGMSPVQLAQYYATGANPSYLAGRNRS